MRLLVDQMCGGIVAHLRMCGHDVHYVDATAADDPILERAEAEDRTIVSRDRSLESAENAIILEATDTAEQLGALSRAGINLELAEDPVICGRCNGSLEPVEDGTATPEYAPNPAREPLWQCTVCGQYFWKGSHWDDVRETLETARGQ